MVFKSPLGTLARLGGVVAPQPGREVWGCARAPAMSGPQAIAKLVNNSNLLYIYDTQIYAKNNMVLMGFENQQT